MCVEGRLFMCLGSIVHEMCRSNPSRSWPVQVGERRPSRRLSPEMQSARPSVLDDTGLSGFAGLHVFPLVSLGETVSLRDKTRQRYEGGASPKPPEQVSCCCSSE